MTTRRDENDLYEALRDWVKGGYKLNNISVTFEIETYLQGKWEGTITAFALLNFLYPPAYETGSKQGGYGIDPMYLVLRSFKEGDGSGYNAWKKNW